MVERRRSTLKHKPTKAKPPKRGKGRPSLFRPEYVKQAKRLAFLGATDADVAAFFEVSESTIDKWKASNPDFLRSLKQGKTALDATVSRKLYHRAVGYSHKAVKIFCSKDGDVTEVPYVEHYPPDTTAGIFWLKNRQPGLWRDSVDVTSKGQSLAGILLRAAELTSKGE